MAEIDDLLATAEPVSKAGLLAYLSGRERPSPKDRSAAGDGVEDDTVPIAALAAAYPGRLFSGGGLSFKISANLPAGFRILDAEIVDTRMVTEQDEYSVLAMGEQSLLANTYIPEQHEASDDRFFASGNHIAAYGWGTLKSNTTGRRMAAFGSRSLYSNTTGAYNSGFGSHTLENCTTGSDNSAGGVQALQSLVNGNGNTGFGVSAGGKITSGSNNSGFGNLSMAALSAANCTGNGNTGGGYRALGFVTTGIDNCAFGRDAGVSITEGVENCAFGADSLLLVETGNFNAAFGQNALRVTTGSAHSAFGAYAGDALTTGQGLAAFGYQALTAITTGNYGTGFGYQALSALTTGSNNVGVGRAAGGSLVTGSGCTLIGYAADVSGSAADNQTAIGNGASCTADNQVTLGNGSVTSLRCATATITVISDRRAKRNVKELAVPDAFLDELTMFAFDYKAKMGPKGRFIGPMAQDLDALQAKHKVEWLNLVDKSDPDRWEARPGALLYLLIPYTKRRFDRLEARLSAAGL